MKTRILICGSRKSDVRSMHVERIVDEIQDKNGYTVIDIVTGDCPSGADAAAREAAANRGWALTVFKADWGKHGIAAGPIRNQEMIESKPDRVIAFWDGKSPGTLDTIKRATRAGLYVEIPSMIFYAVK